MALDMLIRTKYPHDELHVVGFAYYAREIAPTALATLSWHGYEYGTNLQHGLMLGAPDAGAQPRRQQSIVVVTRRRADRAFRERPGRVQLPADAPDHPRDAQGGRSLHARRHHDQHLHARAVTAAGRVRRPHDAHQPRPRVLCRPRTSWASTCWSTTSTGASATTDRRGRLAACDGRDDVDQ